MINMKLNHWFIKENNMSISLMNYFVFIEPIISDSLKWKAIYIDSEMKETEIIFNTLEDAIDFVETNKSIKTNEDVKTLRKVK